MKRFFLVFFVVLTMVFVGVKADENLYRVSDSSYSGYDELLKTTSYEEAYTFYLENKDDYHNLVLFENDRVIDMEYGIVEFKVEDGCKYNISYKDINNNSDRYLNGCYGIDGAYLGTSNDGKNVSFVVSNSFGYTSSDNVILHPYESLDVRLSTYTIENGYLYHQVKTQLNTDFYSSNILLDFMMEYLKEGEDYYSYDGHYFYNDFYLMIDDLKSETYDNAVNAGNPYYNYYLYLPHRTLTNYSYDEIESYMTDTLKFDKKLDSYLDFNRDSANDALNRSQYVGEITKFFESQYLYGANASMMISLSINESAYGKSSLAYGRNNLFGHAAFDSDVERNASRYLNVGTSIYSHAKYYISERYGNPERSTYFGSFFGNKQSGMNVMYASDPYWGEKAGSYYFQFDKSLGLKDYNRYAIGISVDDEVVIYDDYELLNVKLKIDNLAPYSMVILEDNETNYKVQIDPSHSDDYRYSFIKSVGYVSKDTFETIINKDKIRPISYYEITFDLNGGYIDGYNKIQYLVEEGHKPVISNPQKDGYEFTGFDTEIQSAYKNDVYVANYRKIDRIELVSLPETVVELNYRISLKGGVLKVVYDDGEEKLIDLDTNMVSGYDLSSEGISQVKVSYCGLVTYYEIEVSKTLDEYRTALDNEISGIIDQYRDTHTYSIRNVNSVIEKIKEIDYTLSDEVISILDEIRLDYYRNIVNFHIEDNPYDLSISGMALTLDVQYSEDRDYFLYQDTYLLDMSHINSDDFYRLKSFADAYGFELTDSFSLSFKRNAVSIESELPFIISIRIKDLDTHKLYTVYRLSPDGDVYKCKTVRSSDYIQFTTTGDGSFMVMAMDSNNDYQFENVELNLNKNNDDVDLNDMYYHLIRITVVLLVALILLIMYPVLNKEREREWNAYKKSLRNAELPQEEKPKN